MWERYISWVHQVQRKRLYNMPNILIIDDEPWVRELLSEELQDEGYRVYSAENSKLASQCVRTSPPALIILDLYLREIHGWNVLCDIKKYAPGVPVLIFTAYDGYRDDPRLSGTAGYVIKNSDLGELKQKVADLLASAQTRPS